MREGRSIVNAFSCGSRGRAALINRISPEMPEGKEKKRTTYWALVIKKPQGAAGQNAVPDHASCFPLLEAQAQLP